MELMSGNEAIALGAWEAGATIGVAYPGTPSTETMEAFARHEGVYAEWCTNEKVALEVALGASAAGARVLVTMKHVGVNVAADPLFTAAYTGVNGGLVLLAADDPGMYSSQNEQDSRFYGRAAGVPVLEPSDSQEALDFTEAAYALSEEFDVPVMLRSTVRISHTKTPVSPKGEQSYTLKSYETDPSKWVMMPAYAKPRRTAQLQRFEALKTWAETTALNREEIRNNSIGVLCSGAVYQHVREALPDASVLKLGVTWPLPAQKISKFAKSVENFYVIEEGSDYLSSTVQSLGITPDALPQPLSREGEISPAAIAIALGLPTASYQKAPADVPNRPPALCAGCPHRLVFKELSRIKAIVTGDIGCYTLGALAPLNAMDTCVDMGASVSMAHGFELALAHQEHRPIVAVIGDSTFAHSGLSSLITTVYNQGAGTICILDNRTTAMTGRQGNPFNGVTLQARQSSELDLKTLIEALGVVNVQEVDPHDAKAVREALRLATKDQASQLSVIIFKAPCVLLHREVNAPYYVNGSCTACGICATLGCPAIARSKEDGIASIDIDTCIGCGQCRQYCPSGAIEVLPTSARQKGL